MIASATKGLGSTVRLDGFLAFFVNAVDDSAFGTYPSVGSKQDLQQPRNMVRIARLLL